VLIKPGQLSRLTGTLKEGGKISTEPEFNVGFGCNEKNQNLKEKPPW
jgi:hypothetical protein